MSVTDSLAKAQSSASRTFQCHPKALAKWHGLQICGWAKALEHLQICSSGMGLPEMSARTRHDESWQTCTEYPYVWSKSTAVCPLSHFTRLSVTVELYTIIVRDSAEENDRKHCTSWCPQVFMQHVYFNEESSAGVILSVLHLTIQTLSAHSLQVGKALFCQ